MQYDIASKVILSHCRKAVLQELCGLSKKKGHANNAISVNSEKEKKKRLIRKHEGPGFAHPLY
ncbi:hypothetical protein JCM12298_29240 [Desulfothermus naphthae]